MGACACCGVVQDHELIQAARGEDLHAMAKLMVKRGTAVTDEVRPLEYPAACRCAMGCCVAVAAWHEPHDDWGSTWEPSASVPVFARWCDD